MDKESGNSRGFGYVTFTDSADAEAAKNGLQGWVSFLTQFDSLIDNLQLVLLGPVLTQNSKQIFPVALFTSLEICLWKICLNQ